MNLFGLIVLWGWTPVAVAIRAVTDSRYGTALIAMLGWMFLPQAGFSIPGLPQSATNKMSVIALTMAISVLLYEQSKFRAYRASLIDLVAVGWLTAPLVTGVTVGAVWEESAGFMIQHATVWVLPYFAGRIALSHADSLRHLLWVVVGCALIYAPLCLFEMRVSPQLHNWCYGFHQHSFIQSRRGDGFRPTVFMQHGLAVAMFISAGMVGACALWTCELGRHKRYAGLAAVALGATLIGCRSFGALALGFGGVAMVLCCAKLRAMWPIGLAAVVPVAYVVARTAGGWDGDELVSVAGMISDRADSLAVRLRSESAVWEAMASNRLLGVLRFTIEQDPATGLSVFADGLWLIALNRTGLVGLGMLMGLSVLPVFAAIRRGKTDPPPPTPFGAVIGGCCLAVMVSLDNLANCMFNPLMGLILAALVSFARLPR